MTGDVAPTAPALLTMVTAADLVGIDGAQDTTAEVAVGLCVDGACEVPSLSGPGENRGISTI